MDADLRRNLLDSARRALVEIEGLLEYVEGDPEVVEPLDVWGPLQVAQARLAEVEQLLDRAPVRRPGL